MIQGLRAATLAATMAVLPISAHGEPDCDLQSGLDCIVVLMNFLDSDSSGTLSQSEAWIASSSTFSSLDTDGDGELSASEVAAGLQSGAIEAVCFPCTEEILFQPNQ